MSENKKWMPAQIHKNQPITAENAYFGCRSQGELFPLTEKEIDGIEMGVLNDGTPYLSLRGLARMCGVGHAVIQGFANNWEEEKNKPRGKKLQQLLAAQGFFANDLFLKIEGKNGQISAFTDPVCMATLEYYAFEANGGGSDIALRNYRLLARDSFRNFIYRQCNYTPVNPEAIAWENFKARLILNEQLPKGYFSIFKEIADFILRSIRNGYPFDSKNVLDISVGSRWGAAWRNGNYDSIYGKRIQHPLYYPSWYPQSDANPLDSWIYPNAALPAFREWLDEMYIPKAWPQYIADKVSKGHIPRLHAENIVRALSR